MRIVFVQHGNYAEAVRRFDEGLGQTYFAQRLSVDAVAKLRELADEVSVICVNADRYNEVVSNGVRAIGLPVRKEACVDELLSTIGGLSPTHMITRTPMVPLLDYGLRHRVRMLAMFADSFPRAFRWRIRNRKLVRHLNHRSVEWVGNHNMNAALSLQKIGVSPSKVIPWDWPTQNRPEDIPACRLDPTARHRVLFVGMQNEAKGIGDLIRAVAKLHRDGTPVDLISVGAGDTEPFVAMADELGIAEHVEFAGLIEHEQVCRLMREVDTVVVPSRHEYPEGLPMTIYDAITSRTPLIASDHPMFVGKVEDGVSGLTFPASDVDALADRIATILTDADLYARLSDEAPAAFRRIECPTKWHDLVHRWVRDEDADRAWIRSQTLAASGA